MNEPAIIVSGARALRILDKPSSQKDQLRDRCPNAVAGRTRVYKVSDIEAYRLELESKREPALAR